MKNEPRRSRDPAAGGEAAGRAEIARANFYVRLKKFEDAARALNAAWHDGVPEADYPFDETPFDDVCRKITRFRQGVDAALVAADGS